MNPSPTPGSTRPDPFAQFAEVRYSLPALLEELKLERTTGSFAMEKLSQLEIAKLYKSKKAKRRA